MRSPCLRETRTRGARSLGSLETRGELFSVAARGRGAFPEHFAMSLHELLRARSRRLFDRNSRVSLEIAARSGEIHFQMWIPAHEHAFVESQLRAAYPALQLTPIEEPASSSACVGIAHLRLAQGNYLPIRTAFDTEPLANVLWTLAGVPADDELVLQVLIRRKSPRWQVDAQREAQRLRDGRRGWESVLLGLPTQVTPNHFEKARAKAIEEKASGIAFDCFIRVAAAARDATAVRDRVQMVAASLAPYGAANSFCVGQVAFEARSRERFARREFPLSGSFVLTASELAALWHLPKEAPPQLQIVRSPALPPPRGIDRGARMLGVSTWGSGAQPIRLSVGDSRYHVHLLGSTGTGKTTAMLNLAAQDIAAGRGVAVLDPKGELVHGLLERIPRSRLDDVVLIAPDELDRSVGINPLEVSPGDDPDLIADNLLTIFKRIYERYWGPRTDDVLKAAVLTLLRRPGSTLAHVPLLLTDAAFRSQTLVDVHDAFALDTFWSWFNSLSEAQRGEAIGPVLNKLRDFLIRPRLRRLVCQPRSTVDLRQVVDSGGILLADLSVGRWGDTTAALVGSFLVARIWQAVLARAAVDEERRRDFFLFIDEFQHFLGMAGPFADVLAEARSLRLSLTIANQHLGQLTRDLRDAVVSNARSRVVFQCGQEDAAYLAREFSPLDAEALMSLRRFDGAARLAIEGTTSPPFTLRTLPPSVVSGFVSAAEAIAASSARFGKPVQAIDQELEAALRSLNTGSPAGTPGRRQLLSVPPNPPADADRPLTEA